jgi:predicted nucleic acid-binding protein
VILADTGAVVALLDAGDRHHESLRELFESDPEAWVLPWAILPEVDYLTAKYLGSGVEATWLADLAEGRWRVDYGEEIDLQRATALNRRYPGLRLGLVDAVVMAMAERLRAQAIVTLDLRHFGAVKLKPEPKLFPRDL